LTIDHSPFNIHYSLLTIPPTMSETKQALPEQRLMHKK
jgi:hypothetical protein